jgi:hypothetical protein
MDFERGGDCEEGAAGDAVHDAWVKSHKPPDFQDISERTRKSGAGYFPHSAFRICALRDVPLSSARFGAET